MDETGTDLQSTGISWRVVRWGVAVGVVTAGLGLCVSGNGAYGCRAMLEHRKNPFTLTPPTPEGELASRERGDVIVQALRAHRAARGTYPRTLAELVPSQLASIDPPLVGDKQWQYERLDNDRFQLRFWIGPSYQNDVITQEAQWRVDR